MRSIFVISVLIMSIGIVSLETYGQNKKDFSFKIDSLIESTSPRTFSGVILITKNGKTMYSRAFGYADIDRKKRLELTDNFRIQSNSKQITAVLILKEVEKGKIDLQSPVRKYLPEIQQSWADSVTVHQLLNFSAGITEVDKPLNFKPGTQFLYGVTTYTMLSKIFEKVTGKKYIQSVNDLFKELNMNNSFCFQENQLNNVVNGYINSNNTLTLREHPFQGDYWIDFIPAGGIVSNLQDLNNWDQKLHRGEILKSETYQQMIDCTIIAHHEVFGNKELGYGYGVYVNNASPKYIGHSGKGLGFANLKIYFPKYDVDVIVLENQYHENENLHYYYEKEIRKIVMSSALVKE